MTSTLNNSFSEEKKLSTSTIDKIQKLDAEILQASGEIQKYKRKRDVLKKQLTDQDIKEIEKHKSILDKKLAEKRELGWY